MSLLHRCHYFQLWQQANHWCNAARRISAANLVTKLERHKQSHREMKSLSAAARPKPEPTNSMQSLGRAFGGRRFGTAPSSHGFRWKGGRGGPVMKKFKTIAEASESAFDNLDDLNPRGLSSFWSRCSRLLSAPYNRKSKVEIRDLSDPQRQRLTRQVESIFSRTVAGVEEFGPRDLARTAHGLAKIIKAVDDRVRGRRLRGTQRVFRDALIGREGAAFRSIACASLPKLPKFAARHLCNLAYANAIAGCVPKFEDGSTLFDHIAEKSIPLLGTFEPRELSNLTWSFERAGASNSRLFAKVADQIVSLDRLGEFKPLELTNILSAFANAGESNPILFEKIANHIAALENLHTFRPEDLSNAVLAFAKAGTSHPGLFEKVSDRVVALGNLKSFKPRQLSNLVRAFSEAGDSDDAGLFVRVADHVVAFRDLARFEPRDLSNVLSAFARAEQFHPRLFRKAADHIVAIDDLDSFELRDLSNVLRAFAKADVFHPELFAKLAAHVSAHAEFASLDEESRRNFLWACRKAEEGETGIKLKGV